MTIDTRFDVENTVITSSNEVGAVAINGDKIVLAPINTRRNIFTDFISEGTNRCILETNSKQSYLCNLYISGGSINYKIEILQKENTTVSTLGSYVVTSAKTIWNISTNYDMYRDIFLPPNCSLYLVANSQINACLLVATLCYSTSIERVSA